MTSNLSSILYGLGCHPGIQTDDSRCGNRFWRLYAELFLAPSCWSTSASTSWMQSHSSIQSIGSGCAAHFSSNSARSVVCVCESLGVLLCIMICVVTIILQEPQWFVCLHLTFANLIIKYLSRKWIFLVATQMQAGHLKKRWPACLDFEHKHKTLR